MAWNLTVHILQGDLWLLLTSSHVARLGEIQLHHQVLKTLLRAPVCQILKHLFVCVCTSKALVIVLLCVTIMHNELQSLILEGSV